MMEEQGAETVVFNWGRPCLPTVYIWSCLQMPLVVQLCCEELGGMVVLLAFVYGGQGCCSTFHNTQATAATKNHTAPNVKSPVLRNTAIGAGQGSSTWEGGCQGLGKEGVREGIPEGVSTESSRLGCPGSEYVYGKGTWGAGRVLLAEGTALQRSVGKREQDSPRN